MCEEFAFVGEVDGADGARDFAAGAQRRRVCQGTVHLRLVTHQSLAGREPLHADRTHERRVRSLHRHHTVTLNEISRITFVKPAINGPTLTADIVTRDWYEIFNEKNYKIS